jgi:hypothetical protein
MDLDGDVDVVLAHTSNNCPDQISMHVNDGFGNLSVGAAISLAPAGESDLFHVGVGDLDADRLPDIVVPDCRELNLFDPGAVRVVMNLGDLQFAPAVTYDLEDSIPFWIDLADLDGDGALDLAVWNHGLQTKDPDTPVARSVEVFLNRGDGSFVKGQEIVLEEIPLGFPLGVVEAGDLDGDGDADLLATSGNGGVPGRLWRLDNDGLGHFEIGQVIEVGQLASSLAIDDFDHDGDLEVALMFNHAGGLDQSKFEEPYLVILENDGTGKLRVVQEFINPNIENRWALTAADLDGDGDVDLSLPGSHGSVRVHLNQGDGIFGPGASYDAAGSGVLGQVVADFDADGRIDVALTGGHHVRTLFNHACPVCPADINADGVLNILDFVAFQQAFLAADPAADCDNDGRLANPADFICFQQQFLAGCK